MPRSPCTPRQPPAGYHAGPGGHGSTLAEARTFSVAAYSTRVEMLHQRPPREHERPMAPGRQGRRLTYPARTALSCRGLRYDHHRLREKYVLAGERSPRFAWLSAVIRSRLRSGATRTGFGSCGMCPTTTPPGTPGGPAVSMALTSTLHVRCTPWRNRSIPTISAGRTDGGIVNVSTVDTGRPAASAQRDSCGAARRPHPTSDIGSALQGC